MMVLAEELCCGWAQEGTGVEPAKPFCQFTPVAGSQMIRLFGLPFPADVSRSRYRSKNAWIASASDVVCNASIRSILAFCGERLSENIAPASCSVLPPP